MKELITKEIKDRAKELRKEEAYRLGVMETKKALEDYCIKQTSDEYKWGYEKGKKETLQATKDKALEIVQREVCRCPCEKTQTAMRIYKSIEKEV